MGKRARQGKARHGKARLQGEGEIWHQCTPPTAILVKLLAQVLGRQVGCGGHGLVEARPPEFGFGRHAMDRWLGRAVMGQTPGFVGRAVRPVSLFHARPPSPPTHTPPRAGLFWETDSQTPSLPERPRLQERGLSLERPSPAPPPPSTLHAALSPRVWLHHLIVRDELVLR